MRDDDSFSLVSKRKSIISQSGEQEQLHKIHHYYSLLPRIEEYLTFLY